MDGACAVVSESQSDGQNWTMSTYCEDPNYECRMVDKGQNVKRCQKKKSASVNNSKPSQPSSSSQLSKSAKPSPGTKWVWVDVYGNCAANNTVCKDKSLCITHSESYWQCMPDTLSKGELCGQDDGEYVWQYWFCPSGQTCQKQGKEYRCK